uniref:Uncharacterized protein n=1 Tax=Babesia bovis TaxID=5865 RepID=S6BLK5_BABBO|nr:hypothetical protein [Babesia bovis]
MLKRAPLERGILRMIASLDGSTLYLQSLSIVKVNDNAAYRNDPYSNRNSLYRA